MTQAQREDPHQELGHDHAGADCSEIVMRVFEYIDRETTPEDGERIRAHLDGCAQCLDEYERDLLLKALVRRSCAGEAAPGRLRAQIMSRITTVHFDDTGSTASVETVEVFERLDTSTHWERPLS
ncbi:MAG: mycothiol system anti-sigma-R factor [Micrococcales bacterium]|nr:mycothiol system anti-sigma-R factor [Micrococcales bacterium]